MLKKVAFGLIAIVSAYLIIKIIFFMLKIAITLMFNLVLIFAVLIIALIIYWALTRNTNK